MEQRIRKTFRRLNLFMPLLLPTGLTPRMNAGQMADSNIELDRIARERELGPVLDNITVPARRTPRPSRRGRSRGYILLALLVLVPLSGTR